MRAWGPMVQNTSSQYRGSILKEKEHHTLPLYASIFTSEKGECLEVITKIITGRWVRSKWNKICLRRCLLLLWVMGVFEAQHDLLFRIFYFSIRVFFYWFIICENKRLSLHTTSSCARELGRYMVANEWHTHCLWLATFWLLRVPQEAKPLGTSL